MIADQNYIDQQHLCYLSVRLLIFHLYHLNKLILCYKTALNFNKSWPAWQVVKSNGGKMTKPFSNFSDILLNPIKKDKISTLYVFLNTPKIFIKVKQRIFTSQCFLFSRTAHRRLPNIPQLWRKKLYFSIFGLLFSWN